MEVRTTIPEALKALDNRELRQSEIGAMLRVTATAVCSHIADGKLPSEQTEAAYIAWLEQKRKDLYKAILLFKEHKYYSADEIAKRLGVDWKLIKRQLPYPPVIGSDVIEWLESEPLIIN